MEAHVKGIRFSDEDIINKDDFIPAGQDNPHNVHGFLLHDHGFCLAVVFADNLEDALDIAADEGKLDRFLVTEEDLGDYEDEEELSFLGNAGEPFDIEGLGYLELPNPAFSFCKLFNR
jgi:hypothetical protein